MNNKYFKYYQRDSKAICHLIPKQFTTGYNVEKQLMQVNVMVQIFSFFFKKVVSYWYRIYDYAESNI